MQVSVSSSTHSLIVRHATREDASALAGLITQLAAHHGDQADTNKERLEADLFTSPPWAVALVAERDSELLGYAVLVRLYVAQFSKRSMDLHHLFVVPTARDYGIGNALVRAARTAAEAEGCAQLVVGTHPDNHRAQSFYRKLGFQDALSGSLKFRLHLGSGVRS